MAQNKGTQMHPCQWAHMHNLRTPTGYTFVAACDNCGLVASSKIDGACALAKLETMHDHREAELERSRNIVTQAVTAGRM